MDSTEFNKYAGALIGAILVFLLLGFFSGKVYGTRTTHGEHAPQAFALEIEESGGGGDEVELTIAQAITSADPAEGAKVFNQCKACHALEQGKNGVGPYLWGVVERDIASAEGFTYSGALAGLEGNWTLEALDGFLSGPSGYAPGTSMSYRGLRDVEDRANVIAYLNEADGTPVGFTSAAPVEAPVAETAAAPAEAPAAEQAAAPAAEQPAQAESETQTAAAPEQPAEQPAAEQPAAEQQVAAAGSGIDWASGDAAAGQKVFRACRACHKVEEGANGVGPSLWGVVGRDIASVDGFRYSGALTDKDGAWTGEALYGFLENPKGWAPGTKMAYRGLRDSADRINLITYLNEADGSPEPLN